MEILKNKQFLRLWANQILLQIAFNMSTFTALLLIDNLTNSRFALAQFYTASILPSFLIGFLAGSVVDSTNKKKLMLVADALLVLLLLVYAFFTHNYWLIVILAFLTAAVSQFFVPAEAATIPYIVEEEQLPIANTLFLFTGFVAIVAGYGLAGPVIQIFGGIDRYGDQAAFIFTSSLTAIGFILLSRLKNFETVTGRISAQDVLSKTRSLTQALLKKAGQDVKIYLPIILLTILQFNIGMLVIIFIDYVKTYLNLPSTSTSLVLATPLLVGIPTGFALTQKFQKKWNRGIIILLGLVIFAGVITVLGLTGHYLYNKHGGHMLLRILTVTGTGLIGTGAVFIAVHARTILQENTPKEMLGRVFALVTIAASAVTPIPLLVIALLTEKADVGTILIFWGASLGLIAALLAGVLKKKLA